MVSVEKPRDAISAHNYIVNGIGDVLLKSINGFIRGLLLADKSFQ
jgi:hypothetical protein